MRRKLGQKTGDWTHAMNERLFNRIDSDNDGRLQQVEFVAFFDKSLPLDEGEFRRTINAFLQCAKGFGGASIPVEAEQPGGTPKRSTPRKGLDMVDIAVVASSGGGRVSAMKAAMAELADDEEKALQRLGAPAESDPPRRAERRDSSRERRSPPRGRSPPRARSPQGVTTQPPKASPERDMRKPSPAGGRMAAMQAAMASSAGPGGPGGRGGSRGSDSLRPTSAEERARKIRADAREGRGREVLQEGRENREALRQASREAEARQEARRVTEVGRATQRSTLPPQRSSPRYAPVLGTKQFDDFDAIDTNNDGVIDRAEWAAAQQRRTSPCAAVAVDLDGDGRADYVVSGVDRDGDGIPDSMQRSSSQRRDWTTPPRATPVPARPGSPPRNGSMRDAILRLAEE